MKSQQNPQIKETATEVEKEAAAAAIGSGKPIQDAT